MSRWYRAYGGTVTDPKLGEVALVAGCSRSVAIAAWHAILESCAEMNDGGKFDATPRRVAVILGEPVAMIEAIFAELQAIGMIGSGEVAAWSKRQYESDSSTERSKKHREAKRNADATPMQRCATPPEAEANAETERAASAALGAAAGDFENLEEVQRRCEQAFGFDGLSHFQKILDLVGSGVDLDGRVIPILRDLGKEIRERNREVPRSWKYAVAAIEDKTRQAKPASKTVPMAFAIEGSETWARLAKVKKESFLRSMLKTHHGKSGVWFNPAEYGIPQQEDAA